jgi:hypothetical protein
MVIFHPIPTWVNANGLESHHPNTKHPLETLVDAGEKSLIWGPFVGCLIFRPHWNDGYCRLGEIIPINGRTFQVVELL